MVHAPCAASHRGLLVTEATGVGATVGDAHDRRFHCVECPCAVVILVDQEDVETLARDGVITDPHDVVGDLTQGAFRRGYDDDDSLYVLLLPVRDDRFSNFEPDRLDRVARRVADLGDDLRSGVGGPCPRT